MEYLDWTHAGIRPNLHRCLAPYRVTSAGCECAASCHSLAPEPRRQAHHGCTGCRRASEAGLGRGLQRAVSQSTRVIAKERQSTHPAAAALARSKRLDNTADPGRQQQTAGRAGRRSGGRPELRRQLQAGREGWPRAAGKQGSRASIARAQPALSVADSRSGCVCRRCYTRGRIARSGINGYKPR